MSSGNRMVQMVKGLTELVVPGTIPTSQDASSEAYCAGPVPGPAERGRRVGKANTYSLQLGLWNKGSAPKRWV